MPKQNRRTNYTNYSSKNNNTIEKSVEPIKNLETVNTSEPAYPITEVKVTEPFKTVETTEEADYVDLTNKTGIVFGCDRLNVRKEPSINSEVIYQFSRGMEVEIFNDKSVEEWYYVCNAAGIEGYCMKKYIDSDK